jgi:hypothetical protein
LPLHYPFLLQGHGSPSEQSQNYAQGKQSYPEPRLQHIITLQLSVNS